MIKKIALVFSVLFSMFSCSTDNVIENVVERYDEGGKKVVHYYRETEDGDTVWIQETWFYKEGMKYLDGPIRNDLRNGVFESYYKSGAVLSRGEFIDGKRNGEAKVFYEDGKVNYEGFYKNGRECGVWKFYDEDGNLYNEIDRDSI